MRLLLKEMCANPLTLNEITEMYDKKISNDKREVKIICCVAVVAIMSSAIISSMNDASFGTGALCMLGVLVTSLVITGLLLPNKPILTIVDNNEKDINFDSEKSFLPMPVNVDNIPPNTDAHLLFDNIEKQNRSIYSFEKYLMTNMLKL
jgi:hypothetical protein